MDLLKDFFKFDLPGEVITGLIVMLIISVFAIISFFVIRKADYKKKPKGLVFVVDLLVEFVDNAVLSNMGGAFSNYGGYIISAGLFIFLSFFIGIMGFPTPLTYLGVTFALALITFVLIHFTSIKYTKWAYFKRFIEPIPVFLPINLISMWAPLLSMSLRLFGNALAGWVLMSIVYWGLGNLSSAIFSFLPSGVNTIFIAPIVAPFLHMYFDLFSGAIQTTVFVMLTMLFIAQEKPEEVVLQNKLAVSNK